MKNGYTSFQSAYDDVNHPGVMLMDFRTWPSGNYYSMTLNFSPKVGIWQMNYSANFYIMDVDLEAIGIDRPVSRLTTHLICRIHGVLMFKPI